MRPTRTRVEFMKKQITILCYLLLSLYVQAQLSYSNISNILTNEHTCIYNLYNTDISADEQLTVENYTDDETSFTILSYSILCDKWCFLTKTPSLLTYNQSFNHGRITANSYKYRFKEPIKMGNRQFYSRPFTKLAILSSLRKQYSIKLVEEGYNLVIKVYPKGTKACIQPMENSNKNDIDSIPSLSQKTQDIQQTYTSIHTTINDTKKVTRQGGIYIYEGYSLNAGLGKNSAYKDFLNNNCTPAFQRFESGRKMAIPGWVLLSVGICFDFGSGISLVSQVTTVH